MSLTVQEKLLIAAGDLERSRKHRFSAEDLVVAAWKAFPDTFGLSGYADDQGVPLYPNSNRVFVEIMGTKPIRKQGLIVKTGTKTFELTEAGRQRIRQLAPKSGSEDMKATFDRESQGELRRLLGARAVEKYRAGRRDQITFHDASSFWGISARSSANEFTGRLGKMEGVLRAAREAALRHPLTLEHGGRAYTVADLDEIFALHAFLQDRFLEEVSVIERRTDERSRSTH